MVATHSFSARHFRDKRWTYSGICSLSPGAVHRGLVHRRAAELLLDALEVVEPGDGLIELVAFVLLQALFHLRDGRGELGPVELGQRGRDVGEYGQALLGDFGDTAEHDDLLVLAAGGHGENAGPDRGNDRRMSRQHAEVTLDAGNIALVDLAREGELFRRDEIEVEGGHWKPANGE